MDAAARSSRNRIVRVHAGIYRPREHGQALIYFNARHDGILVEAVGDVTLTAANPAIADQADESFPAVVNHVVYFGDGISEETILRGFKITGANGHFEGAGNLFRVRTPADLVRADGLATSGHSPIEANAALSRSYFFFSDGGGILIYGRSYPTIENVEVAENVSPVCGGGVSVQHLINPLHQPVRFKNCVFRNNRAGISGGAVDILTRGSWVSFEHCLFVGNASNEQFALEKDHGFAAVTVFPHCRVTARNCTFTGNRNGVDDRGTGSTYVKSIFWNNSLAGGKGGGERYELLIKDGSGVRDCAIYGEVEDPLDTIDAGINRFHPPDPHFDAEYVPLHTDYGNLGYRPARRRHLDVPPPTSPQQPTALPAFTL
jgi:hypothetical protein